jgi:alcohol sulfotransferase
VPVGHTIDGSRPLAPRLYALRNRIHARWLRHVVARAAVANRPVYLCSYPKTGRTWLRYLLAGYIDRVFGCDIGVDLQTMFGVVPNLSMHRRRGIGAFRLRGDSRVPLVLASHAPREVGGFDERNDAIFLLRGVHDVIVSSFFHASRQRRSGERYRGDLRAFITDPNKGVERFVRYHNTWAEALSRMRHHVVTYEDISRDPRATFRRVLEFLALPIEEDELTEVVRRGEFDAMQALERRTGIDGQRYDRGDPESLRMRRGRIGGHSEYLSADDVSAITEICRARLVPAARALFEEHGLDI